MAKRVWRKVVVSSGFAWDTWLCHKHGSIGPPEVRLSLHYFDIHCPLKFDFRCPECGLTLEESELSSDNRCKFGYKIRLAD